LSFHFEDTLDLKIALARKMIAKFCQKERDTPNQDRMSPSNHASKKRPATARTTAPNATPRAVEVFIDQAARAPEGISTISGSLESSN
jgi:hypothetical protein